MYVQGLPVIEMIDYLKVELKKLADSKGLNHEQTIECSQKLDQFLVIYQRHNFLQNKKRLG